jgi:hypothetical protein
LVVSEQTIFCAALDIDDPAARSAYLDQACAGDAALRRQVEALLAAHERSGEFLDRPAGEQIVADLPTREEPTSSFPAAGEDEENDLGFLQPPTRPDALGRLGNYEILEVLGRGGFGVVLKAFDDALHRVVAIKGMAPNLAVTSPARKRFSREARTSAAIRDENIVHIYDVQDEPIPYLVMEFIAGETLQQRLDRTGPLDAALTPGRVLSCRGHSSTARAAGTGVDQVDVVRGWITQSCLAATRSGARWLRASLRRLRVAANPFVLLLARSCRDCTSVKYGVLKCQKNGGAGRRPQLLGAISQAGGAVSGPGHPGPGRDAEGQVDCPVRVFPKWHQFPAPGRARGHVDDR